MTHSSPTRRSSDLRNAGGIDDHATLFAKRFGVMNARSELRQHVETAEQIDRDDLREVRQRQCLAIAADHLARRADRSEEHTSELQSLMRKSYAVFCLKKKKTTYSNNNNIN